MHDGWRRQLRLGGGLALLVRIAAPPPPAVAGADPAGAAAADPAGGGATDATDGGGGGGAAAPPSDAIREAALNAIAGCAVDSEVRRVLCEKPAPPPAAAEVAESTKGSPPPKGAPKGDKAKGKGGDKGGKGGGGGDAPSKPPPPPAKSGAEVLIDLLKSSAAAEGAGVLRAACVAVGAVGRDAAAAAALLELGALRALEAAAADEEHPARCAATATIEVLARAHPSFQFWFRSYVGAREPLPDGFLDVGAGRPFATAKQLAGSPPTDAHEVLLVDASTDAPLAALIERARLDAAKAEPAAAAAALATIVSDALGGAVDYEEYAHYDCRGAVADAKARAASDVVPLGALARGGARHRALLYKVLADRCGVACELRACGRARGAHARHAWVVLPPAAAGDAAAVVDLLHDVGALLPEGSDEARQYQRADEFAFSALSLAPATGFTLLGR